MPAKLDSYTLYRRGSSGVTTNSGTRRIPGPSLPFPPLLLITASGFEGAGLGGAPSPNAFWPSPKFENLLMLRFSSHTQDAHPTIL